MSLPPNLVNRIIIMPIIPKEGPMKFTGYGYRINQIAQGAGYTWLFLPGSPGLGSEYLIDFCKALKLPGTVLLLDFPKDGTNTAGTLNFEEWKEGLIALLQTVSNPILVTHSFSGMFVLNTPEIESCLAGLVIMNTTTTNSFFEHVSDMQQKQNLPDLVPAASEYHLNPSDELYKKFWDTYKYYCFTAEEIPEGEKMIPLFAFNNESYYYTMQNFYADYKCKWQPSLIPAMTIASEYDFVCPPHVFINDKRFQSANIINKMIGKAGHCPWILHLDRYRNALMSLSRLSDFYGVWSPIPTCPAHPTPGISSFLPTTSVGTVAFARADPSDIAVMIPIKLILLLFSISNPCSYDNDAILTKLPLFVKCFSCSHDDRNKHMEYQKQQ